MRFILTSQDPIDAFVISGGGKAANMARLTHKGFSVPDWFCVPVEALRAFVNENDLEEKLVVKRDDDFAAAAIRIESLFLAHDIPKPIVDAIEHQLEAVSLNDKWVAVRSSGLDEDSAEHSFAGQFSSYLFQKGLDAVLTSIKRCWASGYSERALSYRNHCGLALQNIGVGVVVQKMVDATSAGVAFSRNPMKPLDRDTVIVSSVWGLGEGLVSGELDADHFSVHRESLKIEAKIVDKTHAFRPSQSGGLVKRAVSDEMTKTPSLTEEQCREVYRLAIGLEEKIGTPQDCEWAFSDGKLYCLQTRPITTLPPQSFYDTRVNGEHPILWDNSNIIESYSGVTSPLTFSFARLAYEQVYIQFCEVMGVPRKVIEAHDVMFRNMLGLIRGRVYYNLANWYRLVLMLPGSASNKGFMETMMGVQQELSPAVAKIFDFVQSPPRYPFQKRVTVFFMTLWRFIRMDSIVHGFQAHFNKVYQNARKTRFESLSLTDLAGVYQDLNDQILRRWQAPIINDYLCMIFFGLLKKLTEKWVAAGDAAPSLQNDLLCGQGDLESTEPTKCLMRIASRIDQASGQGDVGFREWFVSTPAKEVWAALVKGERSPSIKASFDEFLDRFGFRCINELKLEEPDLNDDPSFVVNAVQSYVKMKSYSIAAIEQREAQIRSKAEAEVRTRLSGWKRVFYFWIVKQARRAVRNRENLRFARTKIFGVSRHLFRAMGEHLKALGTLKDSHDIFYLTVDEILSFIEGRGMTTGLSGLVEIRKREFDGFKKTPPPPSRFLSTGAVGVSNSYPQVLSDADLLRGEAKESSDPNILLGTSCCPGVVEGVVRVVHELKDCEGLNGEILVTERTDPGWVPLYPSCSGLLIERGSLLSHSAVVARELGLPTIVGISGGLMTRLKTGQKVRVDAAKGEVRILL